MRRRRVFGSTFTVPMSAVEIVALEWPSVTRVWPTPSLAELVDLPNALDCTCGVPARFSTSQPVPGVAAGLLHHRIPTAATNTIAVAAAANPKDQREGKSRCQNRGCGAVLISENSGGCA